MIDLSPGGVSLCIVRPTGHYIPLRAGLQGLTAVVLFSLLLSALPAFAEPGSDWPQFRGPHQDGISRETGLLTTWPDGGPTELWRRPLGEGYSALPWSGTASTPCTPPRFPPRKVRNPREGEEAKAREFAAAFDAKTGKELWRVDVGEKLDTEFGNGPRSTPAVDGDTVYVLSSHGRFAALDIADGEARWQLELTEDFGSERPYWGFSTSVLVDGDRLILEAGGKEGKTLVALNKKNGRDPLGRG